MNKFLKFLFAICLLCTSVSAQDIITTRSGDDIKAKVAEIGLNDIKYKRWESLDGPIVVIAKEKVLLIRYEDGTKEIFEQVESTTASGNNGSVPGLAGKELYKQGASDATRYYQNYKSASVVTLVTSILVGPVFGLIPAIACASSTPNKRNLDFPSIDLFERRDYAQGYIKQARRIKSHKVWTNFGIGAAIAILITILASAGQ
jgi:hypothetical protein